MVDQEISQHRAAEGSDERCHHRVSQGRAPLSQNRKCERFWTLPEMLCCAKELGLKARSRLTTWERLVSIPMPAIVALRDGGFLLLGACMCRCNLHRNG